MSPLCAATVPPLSLTELTNRQQLLSLNHISPQTLCTTLKMNMTSKTPKLLRLLKPLNPKTQSFSLHLLTQKPSHINEPPQELSSQLTSSSLTPIITQVVDILKSNDSKTWKSNDQLNNLITRLSNDDFLKITRNLGSYATARHFVEHLMCTPNCPDGKSVSFVFQAGFELAGREPDNGERILDLFKRSREMGVVLTVNSVTHVIRCLSRGKLIDEAMMVYDGLDDKMKNVHVRNTVIDELIRNRRFDDAVKVLDEMLEPNSECLPDETTRNIVFSALWDGKRYVRRMSEEESVKLVSRFCCRGLFPDSVRLVGLIVWFCSMRRCDVAWQLLHAVMESNGPVDVVACNALLSGLRKAREYKKMNILLKEMQEKGINPNAVTIAIGINHLVKSLRINEALELFEKMKGEEIGDAIESDVVIYNTLINGLCKAGRVEEGLAIKNKMISEGKCSPTTATYNCLIDGFCKDGELEKSLEFLDEMNKEMVEPNIITVNTVVDGMCRHGRAGSALKFYREMQEKGLDGNAVTYTTLISGFCGVNNIRKAMELLDEMKGKCSPDVIVYYTLISGLSQASLMDDVESVLSEMKVAGFRPDLACYNVMISGFCKKNRLSVVHRLLKDMEKNGVKPDSVTYNTLISHFSKIGDLKMSHRLLKQMVNDKVVPTVVTYGTLIHACCVVGELDEAMKIFREMYTSTRIPPNTVIYNTLIDSLCRRKMVKAALTLFEDMLSREVSPNTNTFNALFKALRDDNSLDKAFMLMDRMTKLSCSPDYITMEVLTEWLSAVGEADKLREFVQGHMESASSLEQPSEHAAI